MIDIIRRGNRQAGVFIPAKEATMMACCALKAAHRSLESARKNLRAYKETDIKAWKEIVMMDMRNYRKFTEMYRALAFGRGIFRKEWIG